MYEDIIDQAHKWLDENFPFFYGSVIALGEPVIDDTVETACVRANASDPRGWEYAIGAEFLSHMTPETLAAVMSHETLHIVFSHLKEISEPQYTNAQALMLAHEIVINDRLSDEGAFVFPDGDYTPIFGADVIGTSASRMNTDEAYNTIVATMKEEADGDGSGVQDILDALGDMMNPTQGTSQGSADGSESISGGSGDNSGSNATNGDDSDAEGVSGGAEGGAETKKKISDLTMPSCVSHDLDDDISDAVTKTLMGAFVESFDKGDDYCASSAMVEDIGVAHYDDTNAMKSGAGSGFTETVQEAAQRMGVSVSWMKILAEVNPDVLRRGGTMPSSFLPDWTRSSNRYAHMRSKVILPRMVPKRADKNATGFKGNSKPLIVLALDLSYSIPRNWHKKMQDIALSVPEDKIDVMCCTFSVKYVPFDIHSTTNRLASGGTDFSAVEEFIRKNVMTKNGGQYPSAVICLTDCEANFDDKRFAPTQEQLDNNWTWIDICNANGRKFNGYLLSRLKRENVLNARDFIQ